MEKKIFEEALAWLADATVLAYFTTKGHEKPKDVVWFEDQFDDFLNDKENKALPFDFPALAFEFSDTKYKKTTPSKQEAEGEFIIHVAQRKQVDGAQGSATLSDHKKLLEYADIIADLFNGHKLPCTARPVLVNVKRDHTNRPIMVDRLTFTWSGTRQRTAGVPG